MDARMPVVGTARLTLVIVNETQKRTVRTEYTVRYLDPEEWATPAWRLTKQIKGKAGSVYDVHLTEHGPECTCPDFLYARQHKDAAGCKHCAALRAVGLLRK